MKIKRFEIVVVNDMVSIKTDDFYVMRDRGGGGFQPENHQQGIVLSPMYKQLVDVVRKIFESNHSHKEELKAFKE